MATRVLMEALSPTMEEGRVVKWLKAEGDAVKAGETLAEVETDKAIMELVARGEGILRKVMAPEGATLEVGKVVAVIAAKDEDISALLGDGGGKREEGRGKSTAAPSSAPAPTQAAGPVAELAAAAPTGRVKASPLAKRVAAEQGVDLQAVAGSGPGGRIVRRDLALARAPSPAPGTQHPAPGTVTDVPLSQIRKAIAKRLVQSIGPIPHFFLTADIDMERTWEAREALNRLDPEHRVSFNDIIIKVVALALTRHQACNAWWQEDHIRYFADVHLGMAVAVADGLITPVVRQAQAKSLREIAAEAKDLGERARARRLSPDEYTGATFSVSNLGMFDIDHFTAVINPPEAGILAVGSIAQQAVVHEGILAARRRMRVTMSCDHRVIDGATGAKFLQTVKQMLENPMAMVW